METLHNLINLRGMREQAFKFAFGFKGGMKQCKAKGCNITTPLVFNLKGVEISAPIRISQMHEGETRVNLDYYRIVAGNGFSFPAQNIN